MTSPQVKTSHIPSLAESSGPSVSREISQGEELQHLRDLVGRARSFDAGGIPVVNGKLAANPDKAPSEHRLTIQALERDGKIRWAVYALGNNCITKRLDCIYEPLPSSRTDSYFARTRHDSLEEAFATAKRYQEKLRRAHIRHYGDKETFTWPERG